MTPVQPDVKSIFGRALAIESADRRAAYLDAACADSPDLRAEVDGLLGALGGAGDFMRRPAAGEVTGCLPVAEGPGVVIGPYTLREQIGEGGMGLVFVAEQQQPVRRKVALKVIKPGMDTRQVVARFEAERQALALMDHPHIAKVLDAGATDSGRPFFVMELVRGVPITEYADAHNLSPKDRFALFIQVCQAVQHAHQKGVIHRDLKPSNVLVSPHDGIPVVKVIDFGIAKALGQQLTDKTIYTQYSQMIGTPLYMSPEQAEVNQLDVDTRSDIYSLGVLLYELLTGTTPFDRNVFQKAAFDEIRRIIREEDPPKPSTRLTMLGATLPSVSAHRGTDPKRLAGLIRGELDWIVMRCLEKDRTRRYDTVAGLANDIRRYLADEPVEARPASVWYRARKACRRNRGPLTFAALFAVMVFGALALVAWGWKSERSARADAVLAQLDAESKSKEIQDGAERMNAANVALDLAAQDAKLGHGINAAAAFDRAIELRPDLSQVWMRRGEWYANMGLWRPALADYTKSFEHPPESAQPWYQYALLRLSQGDAEGYQRVCRQMRQRFSDSPDPSIHGALVRACGLSPDAVGEHDLSSSDSETVRASRTIPWGGLYIRGLNHYRAGRYSEAVRDLRASLAMTKYHARSLNFPVLAMALYRSGETDGARQELEQSRKDIDRYTRQAFANTQGQRDAMLPWQFWHDWAEVLLLHSEACRLIEDSPPPEDLRRYILSGRAFASIGHTDQALQEYNRAIQVAPNDHQIRLESFRFHADMKHWSEAEAELAALKKLRPDDADIGIAAFRAFAANGRRQRAVEEYRAAVKQRPADFNVLLERFRFHDERGEVEDAAAAYTEATRVGADDHPFRIQLGDACAGLGQWAKARDEYLRTLDLGLIGDGELTRTTWLRLALLQLYFNDVDGYRRTCSRLFEQHASNSDWRVKIVLLRISHLHPDPGISPEVVATLLTPMQGAGDPVLCLQFAAMNSLRLGKDEVEPKDLEAAWNRFHFESQRIAHARVLHARGDFARARSLMNLIPSENRKVDPTAGTSRNWDSNLETQLWYTQAEAVIQSEKWRAVEDLMKKRQWAAAIDAISTLLESRDKSAQDWGARAGCLSELGRWSEALTDSAKAYSLNSDWLPGLQMHSLVVLQTGDHETYRKVCRQALLRHAGSTNSAQLNNLGWLCALDSSAREEAEQALELLERSLKQTPHNTHAHTYACLLYRVGRYDDALKELNELIAQPGYPVNAYDWLFLAMTEVKLGQTESARSNLERSVAWITANNQMGWQRRTELERFRAETEALIGLQE